MRNHWLKYIGLLLVNMLLVPFAALAQDGVVPIGANPDRYPFVGVIPGVCTTSFPIMICQSGSYRLTSNIQIKDRATTAIQITADNVTLDLNGFAISGPVTCTAGTYPLECSPGGATTGIGITSEKKNITVTNGTVRGMGSHGIQLNGAGARVEGVHVESNIHTGILINGLVTRSTVTANGAIGIYVPQAGTTTISQNTVTHNGSDGVSGGALVVDNTISYNGGNGISGGLSAINNVVFRNKNFGIWMNSGFGGNSIFLNTAGATHMGNSMHNNICDDASC